MDLGYKHLEGRLGAKELRLLDVADVLADGLSALSKIPQKDSDIRLLVRMSPTVASRLIGADTWVWKGFAGALVGLAYPGPHVVYDFQKLRRLVLLNMEVSDETLEDEAESGSDELLIKNLFVDVPEFHSPIYVYAPGVE